MNELQEIIKAYDQAKNAGQAAVLATVVHVEGSSYRRPGARMLVLENGIMIGAISGGCLEGDALKKALLTFVEKKSRLITYDTSDEDDASVGIQLGCEGIIQVLFEWINPDQPLNPIELLRRAISQRQNTVLVTLFDLNNRMQGQIGTAYLHEQSGSNSYRFDLMDLTDLIMKDAGDILATGKSVFKEINTPQNSCSAFYEFLEPSISVVVVGAGNDAIPLMKMAHLLGWEIKVADGRKTHANAERFFNACQVLVSKPESLLDQIAIDARTCFVLMTHNYRYDLQMLRALLHTQVPYVGVLGPRKKLDKMLKELQEKGFEVSESMLAKIHGPTGLDIGAETAEEIALSILAEIQAVFNGKTGGMLRDKNGLIHS